MSQTVEICYNGLWNDYLFYEEEMTFGEFTAYLLERFSLNINAYDGLVFNGRFVGDRLGDFSYGMKMQRFFLSQPATVHLLSRRATPTVAQWQNRLVTPYPNRSLASYRL